MIANVWGRLAWRLVLPAQVEREYGLLVKAYSEYD